MSDENSGRQKAIFFVVVFFPFFLGFLGNWLLFSETGDQRKRSAEASLEAAISQIDSEKDPYEYFSKMFRRIEHRVFGNPDPRRTWENLTGALKRRYGKKIETILLDGSGNPVPGFSDRPVPRILVQKFFHGYGEFLSEKKPMGSLEQSFVKSFLGSFVPIEFEIHSRLIFGEGNPKKHYIYLSKPNPSGMFVIFFKPGDFLREMALSEQISRVNRSQTEFRLSLARAGEKSRTVLERLGCKTGIKRSFWKILGKSRVGRAWIDDVLLIRRILFPSIWVVGKTSLTFFPDFSKEALGGPLLIFLFLGGIWLFFPVKWLLVSVRGKLLFSFLYASVIPLVIMALTARSFLENRKVVLINETHQKMESALFGFDRNFKNHLDEIEENVHHHYFSLDSPPENGFRDFLERFEKYRSRYHFDSCKIFDRNGVKVFDFTDKNFPTIFGGQVKLLGKIAQQVIFRINSALTRASSSRNTENAAPSGSAQKVDPVLAGFPVRPHFFNEFVMGNIHVFFGSIPLGNPDNYTSHIAYCLWNRNKMEWDYVKAGFPGLARKVGRGEFFAWSPNAPEMIFPKDFQFRKSIDTFLSKVNNRKKSYRSSLEKNGKTFFLTGVKGTVLHNISLLAISSNHHIRGEINGLRWRFQFLSLAILGTCIIIGFLLSRLFIDPVAGLTQGMEAISRRDFAFQIPIASHDELGNLSDLFNETIIEFKDLEIARTIQESLFPTKKLQWGKWEIFGSCRSASRVGGDYFDFFPLDETRAVIMIGDVSGHGVGAALVVAMVKGGVHHPATLKNPTRILEILNRLLLFILNRKKMMSCCLGILDKADDSLLLANAGQAYPIRVRDRSSSFLELKGYPLGSVKNWKADSTTIPLQKGDVLAFYTDGLVEATDSAKKPIGYDRFSQALPELLGSGACETEGIIRKWHHGLAPMDPPEDDISLIIVQETSGKEDPS